MISKYKVLIKKLGVCVHATEQLIEQEREGVTRTIYVLTFNYTLYLQPAKYTSQYHTVSFKQIQARAYDVIKCNKQVRGVSTLQ